MPGYPERRPGANVHSQFQTLPRREAECSTTVDSFEKHSSKDKRYNQEGFVEKKIYDLRGKDERREIKHTKRTWSKFYSKAPHSRTL